MVRGLVAPCCPLVATDTQVTGQLSVRSWLDLMTLEVFSNLNNSVFLSGMSGKF